MQVLLPLLGSAALAFVLIEVIFRINHPGYKVSPRIPQDQAYITSHPHLSFAYKKHGKITDNKTLPYPLHPGQYQSFHQPLRLNNLGHFGDDVALKKSPGTLRIACLGSSTTANNISYGQNDFSYPGLLRQKLAESLGHEPEVLNCGIGGWVSTDIFVNFCLNIIHLKPDYVIYYHGVNDLPLHLMPNVQTDYSHGRKNLGEVLHLIRRADRLPKLPFWKSYEFAKDKVLGTGNVRREALIMLQKQPVDFEKADPWRTLWIEKEILRNLFILCQHHGIKPVIASFCHYAFEESRKNEIFSLGVAEENRHLKSLADEFDAVFVDQAALIPREDRYFVDDLHFTPDGMNLLAENFCRAIINDHKAVEE